MRATIFALATASGRAAVAIMRVSGPAAGDILDRLCVSRPKPRRASLRNIFDSAGEKIDQALVLWFPAPGSFTGEDVFELQLHGGLAVIDGVTEALTALGAQPAEPGAFTRRAFEAGRLELSQAEAIADLVDAETQAQRRQALSQMDGAMARRADRWRDVLIDALAFLGAQMDFPDEDLPSDLVRRALQPLDALRRDIEATAADDRGERIRDGFKIALIGPPNAGKSSLLNALLGRDAAIVTPVAGTTRDVIEAQLEIEGFKVLLADTAGLRESADEIEIEGIRRAYAFAEAADLRLWLMDLRDGDQPIGWERLRLGDVVVLTKADLVQDESKVDAFRVLKPSHMEWVSVSVKLAQGLDDLLDLLRAKVLTALSGAEFPGFTRLRHKVLLEEIVVHLTKAMSGSTDDLELISENIRLASRALEKLAGRVDPEDVLDRIFGSFCIGK